MAKKQQIDLSKYEVQAWPIDNTIDTPLNKRVDLGDIESLAESIRKNGIECPMLGRPSKDRPGFVEIVWGKRRRHAAKLADKDTLPLVIREMTDLEVLDAQFVENQDRKDFTPLEEASLYRSYQVDHKLSVEQIAERVARHSGYVLRRMRLLALVPAAQEALNKGAAAIGSIELGAAEHLACYPASTQDRALPHLLRTDATAPMSGSAAKEWLATNFTLKLAKPPFDTEDAGLVPGAGRCSACPKRTGNQAELFADLAEDTCTDDACYDAKAKAAWTRQAEEYVAKGCVVLDEAATREVFGGKTEGGWLSSFPVSNKYVGLDDVATSDEKTYRQVLGGAKGLKSATIVIARNPQTGKVFELLDAKEAASLAEERKVDGKIAEVPPAIAPHTAEAKEERKAEKQRARAQQHVNDFVMATLVGRVASAENIKADAWRLFARLIVDGAAGDVLAAVARRRELLDKNDPRTPMEVLHAHVEQLPAGGALGLIFEISATRGMTGNPPPELKRDGVFGQLALLLEVEWAGLLRDAKSDFAALGTGGTTSARKASQKAEKGGACRVCGCTDRKPCGEQDDPCTWHEEPTATKAGLCSYCSEPMEGIVEILRTMHAKEKLTAVLRRFDEDFKDLAPIMADEDRKAKILTELKASGRVHFEKQGKAILVTLNREPSDADETDESEDE